jgi:cytochrome c-type biogenesis protein CcmH
MAQERRLGGKPEALLARALQIDPRNQKALALSATALLERGDVDAALARWRELRQLVTPGSDDAREIDAVIAEVEEDRRAGGRGGAVAAPVQAPPSTAAAPKALTGRVEVDPKLASRIAPDDTVFIVARAVEGPRIPLAVMRLRARELPAAFRLDDSMGMVPEMKLSAAPRVIVEARVSRSGNAMTQSGDLRGTSAPLAPGSADIRIVVGEIVP